MDWKALSSSLGVLALSGILKTVSTKGFWYCILAGGSAYLTLAPVALKWEKPAVERSYLALAVMLPAAWWLGQDMEFAITELQVKRRLGHQYQVDELTHTLNRIRASYEQEIKLITGHGSFDEVFASLQGGSFPQLPGMPDPASLPAAKTNPVNHIDDELFFDIERINPPNPTMGKNILIIAEQGVGKTTLAKYLAGEVLKSDDIQVYDLDDDGKTWGNLPVWGTGDDATEIAGAMQVDLELFDRRTQDRVKGRKFGLSARIVDENPAVYDAIPDQHEEWTFKMGSRARKRGFVTIILTQERDPEANGLKSNRLRNYNQIYLGKKQVNHALNYLVKPKAVADELRPKIAQCDRPALVEFNGDWHYWNVPDLRDWEQQFNTQTERKINPSSDAQIGVETADENPFDVETLERSLSQSATSHLPDVLVIILNAAKANEGTISARDCQRLKGIANKYSADEIKGFLATLKEQGWGDVQIDPTDARRWVFWLFSDRSAEL